MKYKKQIKTFLGIFLLLFGLASGITLLQQKTIFRLRANPKIEISKVWVTNIKDNSATIIWKTTKPANSFVRWNENNSNSKKVAIPKSNKKETINYVELQDLNPSTIYKFSIVVDDFEPFSEEKFQTAQKTKKQTKNYFINGQILSKEGKPIKNAIIIINVSGSSPLSVISNHEGKWSLDIASARTQSLSNYVVIDEQKTLIDINVYTEENSFANIKTTPVEAKDMKIFL